MKFILFLLLSISNMSYADESMNQNRFYELVDKVSEQYIGQVENLDLVVEADWEARQPSAYTFDYEDTVYLIVNGGLARLENLSEEDFVFQLCYKLEAQAQNLIEHMDLINLKPVLKCEQTTLNNEEQFRSWLRSFQRSSSQRIAYSQGCRKNWTDTWSKQFISLLKANGSNLMRTFTNIPKDIKYFCPSGKLKVKSSEKSTRKNEKAAGLILDIFRSMASAESGCRPKVTAKGATGTAVGLFQMGAHDAVNHRCRTTGGAKINKISQLQNAYNNMKCAITIANNVAKQSKHKNYIAAGSKGHIGVLGAFWAVVRTKGHGTKPRGMVTSRSKKMCKAKSLSSHFGKNVGTKIKSTF